MRRFEQDDRTIKRREARLEGRRYEESISEMEMETLDSQRHDYLSDWTLEEQERFKSQQSAMWALIPAEHRTKAERFARGH